MPAPTTTVPPTATPLDIAKAAISGEFVGSSTLTDCVGYTDCTAVDPLDSSGLLRIACPVSGCVVYTTDPVPVQYVAGVEQGQTQYTASSCSAGDRPTLFTLTVKLRSVEAIWQEGTWRSTHLIGTYEMSAQGSDCMDANLTYALDLRPS